MKLRSVLLAAALAVGLSGAPGHAAEDPKVLVAARGDGALVKVTLIGRLARIQTLVPGADNTQLIPTQANGSAVSYVAEVQGAKATRYDVGVVDAESGEQRLFTRDGKSGHVLVSRDGRFHYILTTNDGALLSLVRTDANGKHRKTLLAGPTGKALKDNEVQLSGSGISPDGRTVYVARTPGPARSTLYGVDTATGAKRVIAAGDAEYIFNVTASPDGKTLAVSYAARGEAFFRVALVPIAGGEVRYLPVAGDMVASAFTPDGSAVILSHAAGAAVPGGGGVGITDGGISLADVANGAVTPIAGTDGLFQAVPVA